MIRATNIIWDVDSEDDLKSLPTEITIPSDLEEADNDVISDYLSEMTGFCHRGFNLVKNEEKTSINYQLMSKMQKNKAGGYDYIPDYDKLRRTAFSEDEKQFIDGLVKQNEMFRERGLRTGFTYNMLYIIRCKCGHFEIFQCPANVLYPVRENLARAAEYAKAHECSKCTCRR